MSDKSSFFFVYLILIISFSCNIFKKLTLTNDHVNSFLLLDNTHINCFNSLSEFEKSLINIQHSFTSFTLKDLDEKINNLINDSILIFSECEKEKCYSIMLIVNEIKTIIDICKNNNKKSNILNKVKDIIQLINDSFASC